MGWWSGGELRLTTLAPRCALSGAVLGQGGDESDDYVGRSLPTNPRLSSEGEKLESKPFLGLKVAPRYPHNYLTYPGYPGASKTC